jgi:hypothetical protein
MKSRTHIRATKQLSYCGLTGKFRNTTDDTYSVYELCRRCEYRFAFKKLPVNPYNRINILLNGYR